VLDRAEEDLDRAYRGEIPELRFNVHTKGRACAWCKETLELPCKALDLHWYSAAIRQLIFADDLLEFLHLIFERRALASQTLSFWRGSAQGPHQDSAYVNYSLPLQFAASWIALEDVQPDAGELFYQVGSHRLPEFLYAGRFKGSEDARRTNRDLDLTADLARHLVWIREQAAGAGLRTERFLAKRGDVLFWSADLAHGGGPISGVQTRKSVVTHYCPAEVAPSYFETKPNREVKRFGERSYYSSSHYR
jgi:ectoine hydroxylase-related dioxygenase (phytanoyl-CoA dioxygenase family)